ncbi:hypothetical protein B0T16DRAFT_416685 [Cercophora newfieldiana]|uniref:Uncharacterized protein n=1 Tax=Cercophora newfieldiana TaxID=92897 RepID=A0AA39Y2S1_9PEZI|nr:hypothetical protein B0T16DRAFT_416685 [Cercophora newfieldiana]
MQLMSPKLAGLLLDFSRTLGRSLQVLDSIAVVRRTSAFRHHPSSPKPQTEQRLQFRADQDTKTPPDCHRGSFQ